MTDGLWDRSIRHFSARVLSQAQFRRLRHQEHQRILQAIVNRDPDEVEQVWRDHVYRSGLETVDYLRSVAIGSVGLAPRRPDPDGPASRRLAITPLTPARRLATPLDASTVPRRSGKT
jgi:hypothetical protein